MYESLVVLEDPSSNSSSSTTSIILGADMQTAIWERLSLDPFVESWKNITVPLAHGFQTTNDSFNNLQTHKLRADRRKGGHRTG